MSLKFGAGSSRFAALFSLLLFFAFLLTAMPVSKACAEELSPAVVAVVDMQKILQDAKAAQSIREQLEKHRKTFQEKIAAQEQKLRDAEQELAKQRSLVSAEAFAEKRKEFEQKIGAAQKLLQEHKRSLDVAFTGSMDVLRDQTAKVVAEIAKEQGVTLVLSRQNVVLAERSLDITTEVLAKLDERIKSIPVELPKK